MQSLLTLLKCTNVCEIVTLRVTNIRLLELKLKPNCYSKKNNNVARNIIGAVDHLKNVRFCFERFRFLFHK